MQALQDSFEGMYNLVLQIEGEGPEWDSLLCFIALPHTGLEVHASVDAWAGLKKYQEGLRHKMSMTLLLPEVGSGGCSSSR